MRRYAFWLILAALTALVVLSGVGLMAWRTLTARQPWAYIPGPCMEGAVFTSLRGNCGGSDTTFDRDQIYAPSLLKDIATATLPCPGLAVGATCYRMWYTGLVGDVRRIGYAVSADGVNWRRVSGPLPDGSVLGAGPADAFDAGGVSVPVVIRDGPQFKMWYTGFDAANEPTGFGHAVSVDGLNWTRVPGPREGGAVLRASGLDGAFDRDLLLTQSVMKDIASAHAPCEGIASGSPCYRMWYEGETHTPAFAFTVGYAVSADGVNWQRVRGPWPDGSVMGTGRPRSYDARAVGVPMVMKDGALFRLWYEAWGHDGAFSVGYAVSADGVNWQRPAPLAAAWSGADDPATFTPDDVWAARVLKDGIQYRMWYSLSTRPQSQRIALAELSPGTPLRKVALTRDGDDYLLTFETAHTVPVDGSVLVTLPPGFSAQPIEHGGFGNAPFTREAALTDAAAHGVAREALLVRLSQSAAPGLKKLRFGVNSSQNSSSFAVVVQTFSASEVLEHGSATPVQP